MRHLRMLMLMSSSPSSWLVFHLPVHKISDFPCKSSFTHHLLPFWKDQIIKEWNEKGKKALSPG